jgi:hypothetical protein
MLSAYFIHALREADINPNNVTLRTCINNCGGCWLQICYKEEIVYENYDVKDSTTRDIETVALKAIINESRAVTRW